MKYYSRKLLDEFLTKIDFDSYTTNGFVPRGFDKYCIILNPFYVNINLFDKKITFGQIDVFSSDKKTYILIDGCYYNKEKIEKLNINVQELDFNQYKPIRWDEIIKLYNLNNKSLPSFKEFKDKYGGQPISMYYPDDDRIYKESFIELVNILKNINNDYVYCFFDVLSKTDFEMENYKFEINELYNLTDDTFLNNNGFKRFPDYIYNKDFFISISELSFATIGGSQELINMISNNKIIDSRIVTVDQNLWKYYLE